MIRRTKVVATLGPASSDAKTLARMIDAGVDVVRINFSHGTPEEHRARVSLVRKLARKAERAVGVLVDLQGPKIRVGKFRDDKIQLETGAKFVLDAECRLGDQNTVGLDYKNLPNDVRPGDTLLLDDGRIVLGVTNVRGPKITTVVEQGGPLSNNKGINRKGGGLTAPALTDKDKQDIRLAAELKADFLAVSFPRSGEDVRWARDLFNKAGGHGLIVSKIERAEAIPALDEILDASDAIMVARGDLAVEVGDAAVPALQKRMIRMAREKHKLTITATQMMESMINSPIPTRAEVSDVANAVLDGTDAVMTSAETATGQYPAETISAMVRVCLEVEKEDLQQQVRRDSPGRIDVENAIARATAFTAAGLPIKAVAALTQSGRTALLMSRMAIAVPIYAMSSVIETRRRVTLFRGVHPVRFRGARNPEKALHMAEDELIKRGVVQNGDLIVLTIGEPFGRAGGTNTLKIVKVGEHRKI
ncbi:MAG: pyruvate kinase [Burkholderiales bacterium]|jgi:pyruvate kinase|nr:pyruvate kinase [Burkholderiales bacterium]MDP2399961.1 pyruvate kinase [Burkholderiales bacterium]